MNQTIETWSRAVLATTRRKLPIFRSAWRGNSIRILTDREADVSRMSTVIESTTALVCVSIREMTTEGYISSVTLTLIAALAATAWERKTPVNDSTCKRI